MLEIQKAIIYVLWEAGKTQNKIAVQLGCSQSAILKITRLPYSKQSISSSKPKTTDRDQCQPNRILISN